MSGYLVLVIAFTVSVVGAGWKGYSLGKDTARAEYAAAQEEARQAADARRQADQDAARKSAQTLQAALGKQKRLNATLGDSLAKHIAALPKPPAGCPEPRLSVELLDDINRALAGGAGAAGTSLPEGSRSAATTDRPDLPGANPPAR